MELPARHAGRQSIADAWRMLPLVVEAGRGVRRGTRNGYRLHVHYRQEAKMSYRVVYGETMPAWEQTFSTRRKAEAFAKKHEGFGDVIFSISKVVPGEAPRSLMAVLAP